MTKTSWSAKRAAWPPKKGPTATTCLAAGAAVGAALLAWTIVGQAGAGESGETRRAAAERFLATPAQQAALDLMTSEAGMIAQLEAVAPGMAGPGLEGVARQMARAMADNRERIEAAFVDTVAKHFTAGEIEALIGFQETPEGAAIAAKMHPFMAELTRNMSTAVGDAMLRGPLR